MTLLNSGSTSLSGLTTYTLSSIPSTYTNLYFVITDAYGTTSYGSNIWLRFNSDTGSNYAFSNVQNIDTTVQADRNSNTTNIFLCNMNNTSQYNRMASVHCTIPLYSAGFYKSAFGQAYMGDSTYTGAEIIQGRWNNLTAINSLTVLINAGNTWTANSSIYIYGVK